LKTTKTFNLKYKIKLLITLIIISVSINAQTKRYEGNNKLKNKSPVTGLNTKSKLLLPTKALDLQILSRLGSGTDPQLKIAVDYGLRDDITIGASNSNYLNTIDFYLRTNYLNKLFDKYRYPINFIYNSIISMQLDKPVIIDELDRLNFLQQLILEYEIRSNIVFMLSPSYIHKNIADTKLSPKGYPWDIWFVGTGIHWHIKDNIKVYTNTTMQLTDKDISSGSQSSWEIGFHYLMKSITIDLSLTNQYHLHGTAMIDDLGVNDYSSSYRLGFQINKRFN